jgi:glycosyltransferase involved in cell wall biosynthesis
MRILILTSRYLPHVGGLETVVSNITQRFQAAGHDVLIVTNRYPRTLPAREQIDGIPVQRLLFTMPSRDQISVRSISRFGASLALLPYTALRLGLLIRQYRPDVLNLHYLGQPALFWWLTHLLYPVPTVISLHGGDVDGEPYHSHFNYWRFRAAMQRSRAVTACSQSLLQQAIELDPLLTHKGCVVHNGVDSAQFTSASPYPHPRPYVLGVGQLVPHKGFTLLMDAFRRVAQQFPQVDLVIAGDGPERAGLQRRIASMSMQERIILPGKVPSETVARLMAGSCLVAMPSYREPFGIVALEAMAAGRPVLATPVGGLPEFAATSVNRLVSPDVELWATALSEMLARYSNEPPTAMLENQQAAVPYSWECVGDRYLSMLKRAATGQHMSHKARPAAHSQD